MKKIIIRKMDIFSDLVFFLYVYITFVINYTVYSDLIILLFIGMTGYLCIKKLKIYYSVYFIIDFIFLIYSLYQINTGIAVYPLNSNNMAITLLKCLIINFITYNYITIRNNIFKILRIYVYAVVAGVITFFFIGWRTLLDGRFLQDTSVRFIGVTADVHSNWVGIVAAMAFIFGLFLFLKKSKSKCVFISGILTICIFLTGSRKAIMLAAIGLFISVFFIYPEKRLRKIFISIFLLMMGYFMIMSVPFLYKIAGSRIEATINYYLRGTGEDSSMSTRDYLITKGMIYIKENLKTGYGLNNYRLIANNYDLYSHNNFIEILFSSGIIGFCIYYSKYILLFIKLIIWRRSAILEVNVLRNILFCLFITMTVFEYWFVTYYERNFMIVHVIILSFLRIYKRPDKLLLTDNKT